MLALTLVLLSVSGEIGRPAGVRLLDDAPLLALVDSPPPMLPAAASDAQVSAQQLQVDLDALKRQRPSLGGGIALVSTGGGVSLLGGSYLAMSGLTGFGGGVNIFLILGVVGLGIGLPLVVIGVWLLYNRLEERKHIDEETARLKQELKRRGPLVPQQRPERYSPPLPMDLPPPQVLGPSPTMVLAQF